MSNINVYDTILPKSGHDNKAYCTIVTLACVTGFTYHEANEYLQDYGKTADKSCGWDGWDNCMNSLGNTEKLEYNWQNNNKITINQFVKKYPRGTYAVGVRGHVLTIKDGKVLDHMYKPRRRIFTATKIN